MALRSKNIYNPNSNNNNGSSSSNGLYDNSGYTSPDVKASAMQSFQSFVQVLESSSMDLKMVMRIHSMISILLGVITVILPHGLYTYAANESYNHMAHEFVRLYGCLTLAVGWFVWTTKDINDSRLMRAVSETFCICYCLQSISMLRAQFTSPHGHTFIHWFIAIIFLLIGLGYGYIRYIKKIKSYSLPGSAADDL